MKTVLRRRHSIHSAGVGLCFGVTSALPIVVPDHHETVRVGVGQGADQHRVEGAEHRRHAADAERQRRDGDRRKRRIAADLPQSVADVPPGHVEPGAMATASNVLFRLFHASELEHGPTPSLGKGRAVADLVGGGHIDEGFQFVIQIALRLIAPDHPLHDRCEAMKECHAPSCSRRFQLLIRVP